MAKGLGVNQESKQKASAVVKDGNKGWDPQPKGNRKIGSRLSLPGTPSLAGKG